MFKARKELLEITDKTLIPLRFIGPIHVDLGEGIEPIHAPIATYEKTLWPSTLRGARVSKVTEGIKTTCIQNGMTRSVLISAPNIDVAYKISHKIKNEFCKLEDVVSKTSRFAKVTNIFTEIVGKLIFIRFSFFTGDAAGHNMTTKASDALLEYILQTNPELRYESISSNLCTDKKVSAVNALLGRGCHVSAEILIPKDICKKYLKTTPEAIVQLNSKKNYIGSILSGGVRSANAHYANILLGTYLATGQDAANIVEGSQGITYAEVIDGDLYFSINCPNIIVGTRGNGKDEDSIDRILTKLGCRDDRPIGQNSQRLARIIGATILCSELSLLAAQTNPGELTRSHMIYER